MLYLFQDTDWLCDICHDHFCIFILVGESAQGTNRKTTGEVVSIRFCTKTGTFVMSLAFLYDVLT